MECVVVKGKEVADSGSLSEYMTSASTRQVADGETDRIRRRWGDKATIGGVDQSPEAVRLAGGVEILYLPEGQTMTPVSSMVLLSQYPKLTCRA